MPKWIESGDPSWPVWLVAEAPGADEIAAGRPLVGQSGQELDRMLLEAGFPRTDRLFRTNICHERPPSYMKNGKAVHNDISQFFGKRNSGLPINRGRYPTQSITEGLARLRSLVNRYHPVLIILLGGTSLWGLCGREGITKWRGSVIEADEAYLRTKTICTFHPADVLRQWTHRQIVVQDLRRALRESTHREIRRPSWNFNVAPSLATMRKWLEPSIRAGTPLTSDTEGWGVVDCIGFARSSTDAICIPFAHEVGDVTHYWSAGEEVEAYALCVEALTKCPITFHNALWDCQVLARRWGIMPNLAHDTMVMQHVAFPGLLGGKIDPISGKVSKEGSSLSLSFIASMYCAYYCYWKDDGRNFDPTIGDERTYWAYNCEDCIRTFECSEVLRDVIRTSKLTEQYHFLMSLFPNVFHMMFDGIALCPETVRENRVRVNSMLAAENAWLNDALGFDLNPRSAPQMQALFYDDFGCQVIKDRRSGNRTLNDTALETIARRTPLLLPLVRKIQNIRTLGAIGARDNDQSERGLLAACELASNRLRCAINPAFVETLRFSTNQTAFGEGTNLQNLQRPPEED